MNLEQILETTIAAQASDVHLVVGIPPVARVNGSLLHMGNQILTAEDTEIFARQILGEQLFEKFLETGECDASYAYQEINNFRVNVYKQRSYCSVAMRLIPAEMPSLESLGLPEVFRQLCMKRDGLILVTGPTGSGKTTTLAAMVDYMSRNRNEHIITIEDPIEYLFSHGSGIVTQRQLGQDTKSFDLAIRAAMREDPDVIIVGEMRDLETISAAITAAETGHLVLSTLHTIGAAQTIDRIIDVFPADQQTQIRYQLSGVLEAVISQRLVPNRTNDGRSLALEIMLGSHGISNLIREGKTNQITNSIQLGNDSGMITMDQSLTKLYKRGEIDEKNLLKFCVDYREIKNVIGD